MKNLDRKPWIWSNNPISYQNFEILGLLCIEFYIPSISCEMPSIFKKGGSQVLVGPYVYPVALVSVDRYVCVDQ